MTSPDAENTDADPTDADGAAGRRRSPGGMDLGRRQALLTAAAAVVVVALFAVLFVSLAQLRDRQAAVVDRLDPAAIAVRDLGSALRDQETGVRGFLLSSDLAFLQPYLTGLADGDEAMAELDRLLGDGAVARADLDDVRAQVAAWRTDYAERVVGESVDDGPGEVASEAFLDESKAAFDEVRASLGRLDQAITERRETARSAADDAYRQVVVVSLLLAALIVAMAVAGILGLRRSITGPLADITGQVRAVADGDLRHRVEGRGPPELVGLGADIDAMRLRILADLERLEDARAAIAQQAMELERSNADLEQFAYVASHDLQEPLRKIAGFCQLLERRYKGQLDDKADQYIEFVVDGAKRMQDLINDLLAFSRVGRTTERFVPVELGAAVDAAVSNLGSVPDDVGATLDVGALPAVDGDPRLLTALFQNLLGNAVKFRSDEAPVVRVSSRALDPRTVELTVADNGIGISEEYAEQIFTLFQRLHNRAQYEGTGIGLALCKKIVEFHGGTIRLDTDHEPPGAAFVVTLPLHSEIPEAVVPADEPSDAVGDAAPSTEPTSPNPEVLLP